MTGVTQFSATGIYSDGTTQLITNQVTWTSSKPAIATVDFMTGLAHAVAAGDTTITASAPGTAVRASALLTVAP